MVHPTLGWSGDAASGHLVLLDQTRLPLEIHELCCRRLEDVVEAICSLSVRGAPAIGVAAAYGVVVGLQPARSSSREDFLGRLEEVVATLAASRPTAVNLAWALTRLSQVAHADQALDTTDLHDRLLEEARRVQSEDEATCTAIGQAGIEFVPEGGGVLTHCNAGGLATAGSGTALAVLFAAADQGRKFEVYADETRPLLQGARLTTWELLNHGIPTVLICDSMAAWAMQQGRIQAVITGADRIAANGDAANKIGTYALAVLARKHEIPFYIAAPRSTFDFALPSGKDIPIEERGADEITHGFGRQTAPDGVGTWNPAFDVTPADHITALITERGAIAPVTRERIAEALEPNGAGSCRA
ncbi:MAG: S-methyl-5-thioribose-1-phosphate isomerase [Planctomycetaceae bacterium]|jgi:methylthioribose-1-phosphate isomerase|nr:S-methyl-5-thioribose-1-phosphate isomerase [Planctomycetaceae bacterium]MDP7274738.1 S-methyl-5-thioribose-1-phosphate isomerase [Planctomycetaceae bacterium]